MATINDSKLKEEISSRELMVISIQIFIITIFESLLKHILEDTQYKVRRYF